MKYFLWGLAALIVFSLVTGYTGTAREHATSFSAIVTKKAPSKSETK